jgi:hypothetical protein
LFWIGLAKVAVFSYSVTAEQPVSVAIPRARTLAVMSTRILIFFDFHTNIGYRNHLPLSRGWEKSKLKREDCLRK